MSFLTQTTEQVVTPAQGVLFAEWVVTDSPTPIDAEQFWWKAPATQAQSIHNLFEIQAAQTPDAIALTFIGAVENSDAVRHLTYGELNRRANQLAHYLRSLGVGGNALTDTKAGQESLVGLCVERSFEMVIGILGILKAGGAYVPLDPAYPQDRLSYLMQDADVQVLVTQRALLPLLPMSQAAVVCLDQAQSSLAHCSDANPTWSVQPEQLAYVIYTSGSTGQPKGVLIEHRQLLHSTYARFVYYQEPVQRYLLLSSFAFDSAVAGIFWALCQGGALVLCHEQVQQNVAQLIGVIAREQVSHLLALPSFYRLLLDHVQHHLPALRVVIVAGESCSQELTKVHDARLPQVALFNEYGPTEAAVWSTVYEIPRQEEATLIPIGQAINNTQIYLLDEDQQPVPPGERGEIYIGGDGIARGYHQRPAITAERFLPDPFSAKLGARLYRTGDIGRYRADGMLEFLGRVDQQVKIRGFRVELAEIEAVLTQHPAIKSAVVLAQETPAGDKRLIAYLLPQQQQALALDQIRAFVKHKLPDYMVPARWLLLDALPLTPNGKVDRRALLAAIPEDLAIQRYVAPRTPLEQRLADLWRQVLKVDTIGVYADFFELGGNSLQAMALAGKVQQLLGEPFYVVAILEAPTIASLAAYLQAHYSATVVQHFGDVTSSTQAAPRAPVAQQISDRIDAAKVAQMRSLATHFFPPLAPSAPTRRKNPPAIFVLAPPRSGTTLLRVMLGGHPRLFAPQELELLAFSTLADRESFFAGQESLYTEGLVRAVMELQACHAEQAKALIASHVQQGISTLDFYRLLQEWLGEKRLVDKTAAYALDPHVLQQAERGFADAFYIHLVRHPAAMIHSFAEVRLDQVFFRCNHGFAVKELAELLWVVSQQNILAFLQDVPAARQCRVTFEELVTQPQAVMEQLCHQLNLDFHPAMLTPYQDPKRKMIDGIHATSKSQGDPNFHQHTQIEATVAQRWQAKADQYRLSDHTWAIAHSLGY